MKNLFNNSRKMDDIIFAKRNKQYGAYVIRASYHNTLLKSLGFVISSVLLLLLLVYVITNRADDSNNYISDTGGTISTSVNLTPIEKPKTIQRNNPVKSPKLNAIATIIKDTLSSEHQHKITIENLNPIGSPNGDPDALIGTGTSTINGTANVTETISIQELPTAFPVEEPEFEGGLKALRDFISKNLTYPDFAREIGKEGTVFVSFIIDEKGQVQNTNVLKGIGAGCDEEAVRVVSKIPKFKKPGKNAIGKPVKVIFNIPIAFRIR